MKGPYHLTIALHRKLYISIIIDQNEGHKIPLTIAVLGDLYLAIILIQNERP
jgi:hypothetical protein